MRLDVSESKDEMAVERRADGRLWAQSGGQAAPVKLVRCFPWSAPGRYLSLRDDRGREVLFVDDPQELGAASQEVLAEALHTADFVHEVSAVDALEDDVEIRRWRVRTRGGPRQFQTALEAWPREAPGGGLLIEDLAGDLYRIPPVGELDAKSRRLVRAFLA
jgi:hypothetical protein